MVSDPRSGVAPPEPADPITPGMVSSLRRAQPWALFVALYGFLCAVLAGISAIHGWAQPDGRALGAVEWLLAMAWLLCAYPLFRFAQALRGIRPGAGAASTLEEALAQQRTFLRILAIALLAEVALVSLAITVSLVGKLAAPDADVPPPLYASIPRACDTQAREILCATIAFYDREGALASWTGWQTFLPKPGALRLSSHPNNVDITYSGEGNNTWTFQADPPMGKVLTLGEYTGAKSGTPSLEQVESGSLILRTPPAWFPENSGAGERAREWPGGCTEQIIELERTAGRLGLRFNVRGIHWDRRGEIRQISMDFEQSCRTDEGTWLVLGRIRATNPG